MRRLELSAALTVCLGLLFGACARGAEPPAPPELAPPEPVAVVRVAVPPAEKLAAAEKQLKDIYKTEYAKTDAPARAALAKELLKQAPGMKDDSAALYVMLRDAREFAASGRDLETALAAAKMLGERFEVDAGELKTASFAAIARLNLPPDDAEKAFSAGLDLLDGLEKDDRYEAIEKVSVGLESLRTRVASPALVSQAAERLKEVRARGFKWQQVKSHLATLKEKPDDPTANLAVGRYYADAKKDVAKALPFLAKGSDAALKALAEKDLANPTDLDGRLAVGDAWWEAGEKDMSGLKPALRLRAVFWYEQIVNDLTGLRKAVVQKRMDQASTVALAAVRPLPLTWKEGLIRLLKERDNQKGDVDFLPGGRLGLIVGHGTPPEGPTWSLTYIHVFDLETGAKVCSATMKAYGWPRHAAAPDGQRLFILFVPLDPQGKAQTKTCHCFFDVRTGALTAAKDLKYSEVLQLVFTLESEPALIVRENTQVKIVRLSDDKPLSAPIKGPIGSQVVWLPERGELWTCAKDGITTYDLRTGAKKAEIKFESIPPRFEGTAPMSVSNDRRVVLFSAYDSWPVVDLRTGKWLHLPEAAAAPTTPANPFLLPDGRHVGGPCRDQALRIWEIATGKEVYSVKAVGYMARVSPDGRFVLGMVDTQGAQLVGLPKSLWPGN